MIIFANIAYQKQSNDYCKLFTHDSLLDRITQAVYTYGDAVRLQKLDPTFYVVFPAWIRDLCFYEKKPYSPMSTGQPRAIDLKVEQILTWKC